MFQLFRRVFSAARSSWICKHCRHVIHGDTLYNCNNKRFYVVILAPYGNETGYRTVTNDFIMLRRCGSFSFSFIYFTAAHVG